MALNYENGKHPYTKNKMLIISLTTNVMEQYFVILQQYCTTRVSILFYDLTINFFTRTAFIK